jgi:hypothetical protein
MDVYVSVCIAPILGLTCISASLLFLYTPLLGYTSCPEQTPPVFLRLNGLVCATVSVFTIKWNCRGDCTNPQRSFHLLRVPPPPPTCKTYMFSYYFPFFFSLLSTMMYKLWWSSKLGLTFISVLISISRLVRRPTQRKMMAWHSQVPWRLDSRRLRWLGAS